jgi:ornithine cyclodeaminase/alanine dehydrogenase-like protein (mu-crystallin family)
VEDPATALREAGDLIIAIREGYADAAALLPMRDIITGVIPADRSRPRVFKSSGMSWEDLAIASAVAASDLSTR